MFAFFKNLVDASKSAGDLKTLTTATEAEIADLEKKLSAKAPSRPEFLGNRALVAQAMIEHRERLKSLLSEPVNTPPAIPQAAAPPPERQTPPAPVTQAVTQIGRTVAALATDPRASVRAPIIEGLGKSMAAAQAVSPCFEFLTGSEKLFLKREWQERGGLSDRSLKQFIYRRAEFCKANKMTPEEVYSCPTAPLPVLVIESQGEQKARLERLARVERQRSSKLDEINRAIIAAAGDQRETERLRGSHANWTEFFDRETAKYSKAPTDKK